MQTEDYYRNGTVTFFDALDYLHGKVITPTKHTPTASGWNFSNESTGKFLKPTHPYHSGQLNGAAAKLIPPPLALLKPVVWRFPPCFRSGFSDAYQSSVR